MLVWGFFISTVLVYHGTYTINSLSHVFGRQRYKTGDASRNNPWLAIITLGEGWHNNHHHYPASVTPGLLLVGIRRHLLPVEADVLVRRDLGLEAGTRWRCATAAASGSEHIARTHCHQHRPCRARLVQRRSRNSRQRSGPSSWLDCADDVAPYLTDFRHLYQGATPLVLRAQQRR